jgi:hypothetical protein
VFRRGEAEFFNEVWGFENFSFCSSKHAASHHLARHGHQHVKGIFDEPVRLHLLVV